MSDSSLPAAFSSIGVYIVSYIYMQAMTESEAVHVVTDQGRGCWGIQLKVSVDGQTTCTEGFVAGQPHLTNKFCPTCCTSGFAVQASRLRCLATVSARWKNTNCEGFWHQDAHGLRFRVINQHKRCVGSPLLLFAEDPPVAESDDWCELPAEYVTPDGLVWLRVGYATLIPTHKYRRHRATGADASDESDRDGGRVKAARTLVHPPPGPTSGPASGPAAGPAAGPGSSSSVQPADASALLCDLDGMGVDEPPTAKGPALPALPSGPRCYSQMAAAQGPPMDSDGILDLDMHFPIPLPFAMPSLSDAMPSLSDAMPSHSDALLLSPSRVHGGGAHHLQAGAGVRAGGGRELDGTSDSWSSSRVASTGSSRAASTGTPSSPLGEEGEEGEEEGEEDGESGGSDVESLPAYDLEDERGDLRKVQPPRHLRHLLAGLRASRS